jgi:hypothetical protein
MGPIVLNHTTTHARLARPTHPSTTFKLQNLDEFVSIVMNSRFGTKLVIKEHKILDFCYQ